MEGGLQSGRGVCCSRGKWIQDSNWLVIFDKFMVTRISVHIIGDVMGRVISVENKFAKHTARVAAESLDGVNLVGLKMLHPVAIT